MAADLNHWRSGQILLLSDKFSTHLSTRVLMRERVSRISLSTIDDSLLWFVPFPAVIASLAIVLTTVEPLLTHTSGASLAECAVDWCPAARLRLPRRESDPLLLLAVMLLRELCRLVLSLQTQRPIDFQLAYNSCIKSIIWRKCK